MGDVAVTIYLGEIDLGDSFSIPGAGTVREVATVVLVCGGSVRVSKEIAERLGRCGNLVLTPTDIDGWTISVELKDVV